MDGATALSILSNLISIFSHVGVGPIFTIVLVVIIGPWVFAVAMAWVQGKRFDAMRQMYLNNVDLVKCYEALAKQQNDVVTLNTAEWSEVRSKIDSNQYCPYVRVKKEHLEDVPR